MNFFAIQKNRTKQRKKGEKGENGVQIGKRRTTGVEGSFFSSIEDKP